MTHFGERLIEARVAAGLSQADLARYIGVSDTYISAIETGRKAAPPHAHVKAMAVCLGLDEEALWGLALADRERRLRERLDGVPTAARSTPLGVLAASSPRSPSPKALSVDSEGIGERIRDLLLTRTDREQLVDSLEALIEILKSMA